MTAPGFRMLACVLLLLVPAVAGAGPVDEDHPDPFQDQKEGFSLGMETSEARVSVVWRDAAGYIHPLAGATLHRVKAGGKNGKRIATKPAATTGPDGIATVRIRVTTRGAERAATAASSSRELRARSFVVHAEGCEGLEIVASSTTREQVVEMRCAGRTKE